ncbi:MAG TPA: carboxypeptidase regulatory-like domain-containing protein, partial [Saprospiraceae bacterium]|nr:carboxypeptidase regulatory-like domain-containing protein [Saprospiraceae bacterium]
SINSNYAELGITYYGTNIVLFASSKKTKNDVSYIIDTNNGKKLAVELYQGIMTSDGTIVLSENFINESENKFYLSDMTFIADYKTVYFTWNNFNKAQNKKDSFHWKKLHIVKATVNENLRLSNIKELPFNNDKYSFSNPYLSKDNKQLFFVSDMPNGYGQNDIYVVDILGEDVYSTPKNLGANVNTANAELFPFVDENNVLYFSSNGYKNKQDFDILKSTFTNSFEKAVPLPSPINTKYDDFEFIINSKNNTGFFASSRRGGKGDSDIYGFRLKKCNKDITGTILNIDTQNSIDNVKISLFHNNVLQETKNISKNSKYSFKLICNEQYKIIAEKEHFNSLEFEIIPNNRMDSEVVKNIELTPIKCTQFITGTIIDKQTNATLENVNVSLIVNNKVKETKITNGTYNFEVDCNKEYKITAKKDNFETTEISFKTSDTYKLKSSKTIALNPVKCTQFITGTIIDKQTNATLENVNVSLIVNNKVKETKITNGTYNFEVDCNKEYKITAKKDNFETTEISFKTTDTYKLKSSKTIALDRK